MHKREEVTSLRRGISFVLVIVLCLGTVHWITPSFSGLKLDRILDNVFPSEQDSLNHRFIKLLNQFEGPVWDREMEQTRAELVTLFDSRISELERRLISEERINAFTDEYYGYLKGYKLLALGSIDLFRKGTPLLNQEMLKMITSNILFDIEDFETDLYIEMESIVQKHYRDYLKEFAEALGSTFTANELNTLEMTAQRHEIPVEPGTITGAVRIGSEWAMTRGCRLLHTGTTISITGKSVTTGSAHMTSALASKASGKILSSFVSKFLGPLLVGLVIDYAITKACRAFSEEELKHALRELIDQWCEEFRTRELEKLSSFTSHAIPSPLSKNPQ